MSGRLSQPGRGIAMVELMVALLVFSIGMLGLASAQLGGKRSGYDALQRSVATALAGDILARVRANAGHALQYRVVGLGAGGEPLPAPHPDCEATDCSGGQLAAFDLWQWQQRLLYESAGQHGALRSPLACISAGAGRVQVDISWLAMTRAGARSLSACAADGQPRHHLRLVTFVGGA